MSDRDATSETSTSALLQGLVLRVRDGDHAALDRLLTHVEGRLRVMTHRLLRDFPGVHRWEETDDVLQQAALRLLRSLKAVELTDLNHFLQLAALQIRRELLSLAQRYRGAALPEQIPQNNSEPLAEPLGQISESTSGPMDLALWTEFHEQVDRLPEPQRAVFDLLYYHALTQDEAAEVLGMSERTVRSHWRNARLALVETLDGRLPGL